MKFCTHCGSELLDEVVVCPKCGCACENKTTQMAAPQPKNTKFCSHCGAEVLNEAVICPKCGCPLKSTAGAASNGSGLQTGAKVFMILSCVGFALGAVMLTFFIIGLSSALDEFNYMSEEYDVLHSLSSVFGVMITLFVILFCVAIAMVCRYFKATKNHEPVSTAFKVCTLIFVSPIAGILMLCDTSNNK